MAVAQGLLPFQVELVEKAEPVTAYAALPLVVEALRAVVAVAMYRQLRDALGYRSWKAVRRHVESLVLLVVAGGEHLSDLEVLHADAGLAVMLGGSISSPAQAKDFLYRFHQHDDGRPLSDEDDAALSVVGQAQIRPEGPVLAAEADLVSVVVEALQAEAERTTATLDVDATLVASRKVQALRCYEGYRAYQPQMALWAEQGVWVHDEFRDGNVPAAQAIRDFLQAAFGALPEGVTTRRLRADSALYDEAGLTWTDEVGIEFAVSADMSQALADKVQAIHDCEWKPYTSLDPRASKDEERQWAEVTDFIPGWKRNYKKGTQPFRYIAIRVRSRQRDLLEVDPAWRHFAVVTNMAWSGDRLLRWHREKQGTVEQGHGVMKNDLGGGVMPCGRFGSNAAWWRLNVLAHNLLARLKATALPDELATAQPKTLRFRVLCVAVRLVRHARRWVLKLYVGLPYAQAYVEARQHLLELARRRRVALAAN